MTATRTFFAIAPRGLEALLAEELRRVGAAHCEVDAGGVSFTGTLRTAYAANLHARLASRVLMRVARVSFEDEDDIYAAALDTPWETWFGAEQTLRVDFTATRTPLRSREFATLRVKDGIVDRLREKTGDRPSIDRARPDVRVFGHAEGTTLDLYLDLSGEALFKRGWRADKGEAPLKEHVAAGLLALSGWTPETPLLDVFCGSGTIVIEAASIAAGLPPGFARRFAFERLRGHDTAAWNDLRDDARARVNMNAPARIAGSDISTQVIELARRNAALAGFAAWLTDGRLAFAAHDARKVTPPAAAGLIVSNPPYGEQSTPKSAPVSGLMRDVAANLKTSFTGWTAWLLSADLELPRQMRLKETRRTVLYNGALECRFFRFELVAGGYRRAPPEPVAAGR